MRRLLNILSLAVLLTAANATPVFSLYSKTKSNTFGKWAEESGVNVVWLRRGKLSFESNLGVVTKLPYESSNPEQYAAGASVRYMIGASDVKFKPSVYTKLKHDLFHTYSQEAGFAATLWSKDRASLGFNAGVVYNYPLYVDHKRPAFTVGLTVSCRL